jgi:hypothetical protein
MFHRVLSCAAALLTASPVHAEWIRIGTSAAGSVYYADPARLTQENGRQHAWIKIDAARDATTKYRSSLDLYSVICASQKIKLLSYVDYDSYGKVIASHSSPDSAYSDYDYNPVTPESMGETIMRVACFKPE